MKHEKILIAGAGLLIGMVAALLVFFGNPGNMGFCIVCFIRDTVGGLGLDSAAAVQYIRPEIIGLVLGSFIAALIAKEFKPRGGSAPMTRFILGAFMAVGALMFLGCPFRMILRLAGGDLNALFGVLGFAGGILLGILFLNNGFSLKKSYALGKGEGLIFPVFQGVLLLLVLIIPALFKFTEEGGGPGALHAAVIISLAAGLVVGALSPRTRMCMVGGIRDVVLFRDFKLLVGFFGVFAGALLTNVILTMVTGGTYFKLGFSEQPIAHTDGLWNALGMLLVGFASVLLGGCPLRQLVLSGEGNSDSAVTVLGIGFGAAMAHNFGLASSAAGPTLSGKIAVVTGIIMTGVIAFVNSRNKKA